MRGARGLHVLSLLLSLSICGAFVLEGVRLQRTFSRVCPTGKVSFYVFSEVFGAGERANEGGARAEHDALALQLWPAARVMAAHVYEYAQCHQKQQTKQTPLVVCELGAGTGLVSLAATAAGAKVIATDFCPFALKLVDRAAAEQSLLLETTLVDLTQDPASCLPPAELYVLSDVFVSREVARGAARHVYEGLQRGAHVLVAADRSRACREDFLSEIGALLLGSSTTEGGAGGGGGGGGAGHHPGGADISDLHFRPLEECTPLGLGSGHHRERLTLIDIDEQALDFTAYM